ncbi:MAG: coproporphyrinogen III oxidase, partial [Chloroflexota bacterium]
LVAAGFRGYEVSNWARPGHESRHNLLYWTRRPVEAVGPGAHAFDGAVRRWTTASLEQYIAALRPTDGGRPRLPPGGGEVLDAETARAEAWILGLRTDRGLPTVAAEEPPGRDVVAWAVAAGLVEIAPAIPPAASLRRPLAADPRVRLTHRGRLLSNEVFVRFV